MPIKFGISQMQVNAPMDWKRIESAVIIVLLPAITTFLMSIITDTKTQAIAIAGVTFVGALVKAVGVFMGESNPVTPPTTSTTTPDGALPVSKN